ncbi:MAG: hypothetical protein EON55_13650 [Alphaproteobacteria bacterium]|nr:MAG: hypothetical protein EON55_13650 [Alphaproteobacteria bacterium]
MRRHAFLPLDACLDALQATIPHLPRSSLSVPATPRHPDEHDVALVSRKRPSTASRTSPLPPARSDKLALDYASAFTQAAVTAIWC